jgi:hypothetical protein
VRGMGMPQTHLSGLSCQGGGTTVLRRPGGSERFRSHGALCASALLHWVSGIGTAVVLPLELVAMAREGQPVNVMGLPALSGPFERLGLDWMVGLGWAYVGLSVLEVLAGILVWRRRRAGALLSVAQVPPAIVFWVGFELPLPPLVAALRLALLWAGREALR